MTPRQQSILVGAAVTGIFTTSYLGFINSCCCLGVILGGGVAVQQYAGFHPGVEEGTGALLGAAAGAAGAVLGAVFNLILRPVGMDYESVYRETLNAALQNMEGESPVPPEFLEQLQGEGTGLTAVAWLASLGFNLLLFAIFGAIGGVIGAAIFGEEQSSEERGDAPEDVDSSGGTP